MSEGLLFSIFVEVRALMQHVSRSEFPFLYQRRKFHGAGINRLPQMSLCSSLHQLMPIMDQWPVSAGGMDDAL